MPDPAPDAAPDPGAPPVSSRDAARQLPPDAPIAMPIQDFRAMGAGGGPLAATDDAMGGAANARSVVTSPEGMLSRRLLLFLLTSLIATTASAAVQDSLLGDGIDLWDVALLALFFPLFGWIAFGFLTSLIGFILLMTGMHPGFVPAPRNRGNLIGKTAVLVPIYNEDVDAVFGRIARMMHDVDAAGEAGSFAFFVLSDSGEDAEPRERAAWAMLAARSQVPLHYRRRTANVARKPGNVADWVSRFGGAYDHMMMLDADSLMSAEAMIGMAQVMESRPSVGLLQTVPTIYGGTTLFQRWMQFNSRLYGPISTAGLVWWSGAEASFWGHNAMIRTRAFAESCGLPVLPGAAPFGGAIMSHDMVEAALLRRRGWAVHLIMIDDSYEEFPPTLIDMAVRDRRWAQGNIQHLQLLNSDGFHWVNRLQLLIGASAYMTSPAWLVLILTTIAQAFAGESKLVEATTSARVLAMTVVLLFGPKLLGIIWAVSDTARREAFGGARAIISSTLAEIPLSMLSAPIIMLTQTMDLISIFRGQPSGWNPQNRDRDGLTIRAVLPRYRWHLVAGVALLALSPAVPVTALWLAPVTLGLLLSPWLASWTASNAAGEAATRHGLFQVPRTGIDQLPATEASALRAIAH
ncbi:MULTISPECIES: glucans biosynthesis glucosyltransferase MdoH [unclassified Sphingomonas]|uniref:glucans biosynthesis glucosyltransferase MdoH n=1 Tax=Sphingomonas sp. PvP015 TaxID=3156388 RepID=UPI00339850AD